MAKKAFILGVNTQGLQYSENDAALMRACLEKYDYEIIQPEAKKTSVQAKLDEIVDNCGKTDTLIFYFSGHGLNDSGELLLLIGEDTTKESNKIHISLITKPLERCRAENRLIILDCCNAGSAAAEWHPAHSDYFRILTASERLEKGKEFEDLKAGFLTHRIHKALCDPSAEIIDRNNKIRINALHKWLVNEADQYNAVANSQRVPIPCLFGNAKADFEIAAIKDIFEELRQTVNSLSSHFQTDLPGIESKGWPFPVQSALDRLNLHQHIKDYLNLFEAFVHLHFVTLASQFYWALTEDDLKHPTDDIKAGMTVLHDALRDSACCGGMAWVERCVGLSQATQKSKDRNLPFPELADIIRPEIRESLFSLARLRNHITGKTHDDDKQKSIEESLIRLTDILGNIFEPYHGLHLAQISETQDLSIFCCWEGYDLLCVKNVLAKRRMKEIWKKSDSLTAPEPPRKDWKWNESLLLYDSRQADHKYVYLMPLGFRYRHPDADADKPVPGLLDSVRWKQNRVSGVFQRHYQGELPSNDWQKQKDDKDAAQVETLNKYIEELCQSVAFDLSESETQDPPVIPRRFDLRHDRVAEQLAENTMERAEEIKRVMSRLKSSIPHRLLLEGTSGIGKSVLMAQIFKANANRAVFVSTDAKPEPLENSVGLRVGMYCLSALNHLMNLPQRDSVLTLSGIQDELRDNLAHYDRIHSDTEFIVIFDGLNQSPDPGGMLSALPNPLPSNLFVIASSQPDARVRQSLTYYGRQKWDSADIREFATKEIEEIIRYGWTKEIEGQPSPKWSDFPKSLSERIIKESRGIPVFSEEWTKCLREIWMTNPAGFAQRAEADFDQHYDTLLPKFLKNRFEEAMEKSEMPRLAQAMLMAFSMIPRALSVRELHEALRLLRQQKMFEDLPDFSQTQITNVLSECLAGFLRHFEVGFQEQWQLSHEILGKWFCETQRTDK